MTCPYLEYRDAADDRSFPTERAFCTAVDAFVQPMRADICTDRYDLRHDVHCERYLAATADAGTDTAADSRTADETEGD